MASWRLRAKMDEIDVTRRYAGHPTIFSIRLHHGGVFSRFPGRKYLNGKQNYIDLVDIGTFSVHDIHEMMEELGYGGDGILLYYHFQRPLSDLDFGLFALANDNDVRHLATFVSRHKMLDLYIEHGTSNLHTYSMSPTQSNVRIVEIEQPPTCSRRLYLNWKDDATPSVNMENESEQVAHDNFAQHMDMEKESEEVVHVNATVGMENDFDGDYSNSGDESDSADSDFLVDEDNLLDDVAVNMKDFQLNIDPDAEWVGDASRNILEIEVTGENDCEVIDTEALLSGSSSDEGMVGQRKKSITALRRAHENDDALVSEPFYVFQSFSSAKEFKDRVKLHAIETRRELDFDKNDKNRVRVVCRGSIPKLGNLAASGSTQEEVNDNKEDKCPWVLYASHWKTDKDWTVKTYVKTHKCIQTRTVKACDYKYLAKEITQQIKANPNIPVKALQEQLQRQYQVDVSLMKAFRAKCEAKKHVRGDYATQYGVLRDYILELQKQNPDTTVKLDVASEPNPNVETRTFRRVYVCIGALKKGFVAGKSDFLGLDGAFMKGLYPGQILSAVALDGNNGVYPLAYAVVEAETLDSWSWFLRNLGDDLELSSNSNFTFMTDRQKGVLPAIAKLFPCAENRYCLRHIHENMKLRWKAKVFKEHLWNCASTCNVHQFTRCMEELKKLNKDTYEWVKNIPPQHWARSHFTGRAHCDALLNNMCEQFNSKLEGGRDSPIVTCLDFIREYIMRKIVNMEREIQKATGPLTPTATKILEKIKNQAENYTAVFCGNGKYQVSGPWMDQCVVDVGQQICSCRRWEITGVPCKHGIAAIWNMRQNNKDVEIPETWVHPCYWLSTWKEMYSFKIAPINGRNMWEKSPCPTVLLPPNHRPTIGRPKKKRKKSALEVGDLVKGNKASRSHQSVTCNKCKNPGHNSRTCKGQKANDGGGSGKGKGKAQDGGGSGKGKGKAQV